MPETAGYSGTPLPRKLGVKPDSRAAIAAEGVDQPLPEACDVVVFFVTRRSELERRLPALLLALAPAGGLWISWPKKSSGLETDLNENVLREIVLPTGLVDNKVIAIDQRWSGLRFVWRKHLRPPKGS